MKSLKKFLLSCLFLFIFLSLLRNVFKHKETLKFYESYRNDYEKALKTNTQLKTQILKTADPYEMERVMRDKLNMAQEGEVVVMLPLPTPTPFIPTPTPKPVYKQWGDVFFKRSL